MQKENNDENVLKLSDKYEPLFEWLDCSKFLDEENKVINPLYQVNTVVITGGRYSQKSFAIGTFSGVATKDFNHRILYTRYTLTSAKDSIIPEFEEKLSLLNCHDLFKVTKDSIKGIHNDSKIVFKGIKTSSGNQTASLKSLKNFSIFILDEAEEMPDFATWDKIKKSMRALDVRNLSILSLNPATEEHWIHEEFFEGKGVEAGFNGIVGNVLYIHSTYRDIEREYISDDTWNEYEELREIYEKWKSLPPKEKSDYDPKLVKKAKYFLHTILGGWLNKAEGVVFEDWEEGEFIDNGKGIFGQDYGFSVDPTTLVKVCIEKSLKKIYVKEYLYKPKMTTSEIADFNKKIAGDTLIIADSAEPRLIEELKRKGNKIKGAEKGHGSVSGGIARMLDYTLVVDPESKNLKKELNNYVWHDKKSNTPIDDWNHCFVGETLITTINGLVPIKNIKAGDLVLTSKGYRRVLYKFNNGKKKVNKYSMQFDIFSLSLCSTETHKIKTDKEWKMISELQSEMMVYQHKHSTDLITGYTQTKSISQGEEQECILPYGDLKTAKYQKGFMSTIKTKTLGTTILKISSWFKEMNILGSMEKEDLQKTQNGQKHFMRKVLNWLKNGINPKKENYSTESKPLSRDLEILHMEKENVRFVNENLLQEIQHKNFAPIIANPSLEENQELTILNKNASFVNPNLLKTNIQKSKLVGVNVGQSYEAEVFDLMVEDCHEYFANGILVHNCIDPIRYVVLELTEAPNNNLRQIASLL